MEDQQLEWIRHPMNLCQWCDEWIEDIRINETHRGVNAIMAAAILFRDRFYTDGFWAPGTEAIYIIFCLYANKAQQEYEECQPGME